MPIWSGPSEMLAMLVGPLGKATFLRKDVAAGVRIPLREHSQISILPIPRDLFSGEGRLLFLGSNFAEFQKRGRLPDRSGSIPLAARAAWSGAPRVAEGAHAANAVI